MQEVFAQPRPLTKDDLKAFKKAKSAVLHFTRNERSYINLIMDEGDRKKDVDIACGVEVKNYRNDLGTITHAACSILFPQYDECWQTFVASLRAGDEITIRWIANNNNELLDRAELFHDQAVLVIRRQVRGKEIKLAFLIESTVCKNNPAKMIRHTTTM